MKKNESEIEFLELIRKHKIELEEKRLKATEKERSRRLSEFILEATGESLVEQGETEIQIGTIRISCIPLEDKKPYAIAVYHSVPTETVPSWTQSLIENSNDLMTILEMHKKAIGTETKTEKRIGLRD